MPVQIINKEILDNTSLKAKKSDRLRMNYNLHTDLNDPLNRLLNAMEPNSLILPHRHLNPNRDELFTILRGKIALFIFDDDGNILSKEILSPSLGGYGADIPAGIWHSVLVLEPDTVLYEVKQGPFAPLQPENIAPWAPDIENKKEVEDYLQWLKEQL